MTIHEMLRAEVSVTEQAELLLRDLGRYPIDAMDEAAAAYRAAADAIRASPIDRQLVEKSQHALRAVGRDDLALLNGYIKDSNTSVNPILKSAADAWLEFWSRYAQKVAFQLVWRHFRRGVSEIYRLHITSAAGRLRQQVEAAALLEVFQRRIRQGVHWLDPEYDHQKLFWGLQPDVKKVLRSRNLEFAYKYGSAVGMHPSIASAVYAVRYEPTPDSIEVSLADEDFNANDPFSFDVAVALPANTGANSSRTRRRYVGTANARTERAAGGAQQVGRKCLVGVGAEIRRPRSRSAGDVQSVRPS
jgi:hypothetical protein